MHGPLSRLREKVGVRVFARHDSLFPIKPPITLHFQALAIPYTSDRAQIGRFAVESQPSVRAAYARPGAGRVCRTSTRRFEQVDAGRLDVLVDQRSGLLRISGVSVDMRRLHEAAASNPDARLAIEMFCYSVREQVAGMIAVLDGIDPLVFTGGIGENDAQVRTKICSGLSWVGVSLDESRNRAASNPVSDGASCCRVHVLASREDEQIARHARTLVAA